MPASGSLLLHVNCTGNAIHVTRSCCALLCQYEQACKPYKIFTANFELRNKLNIVLVVKISVISKPQTMTDIVQLESPDGDSAIVHLHGELEFFQCS